MLLRWKSATTFGLACAACICSAGFHSPASVPLQQTGETRKVEIAEARPVADLPIADPEAISGLWESSDGHGVVIDLQLKVDALASPDARSLDGVEQRLLDINVFLYQGMQAATVRGKENQFEASVSGGMALLEDGRLTVRVPSSGLELHQVRGEQWAGTMLGEPVLFRRPQNSNKKAGWFVSTWREQSQPGYTCLHVAQNQQGHYLGWSDALVTWGNFASAPGLKRPNGPQHYGELMKVNGTVGKSIVFDVYAYSALCCSHSFVGTPSAEGHLMHAEWKNGPNMATHSSNFERMPGDRCLAPKRH